MYNILVMLNEEFTNFGRTFLNSLHSNTDISKINKIFINNIGISEQFKNEIQIKYSKIQIIETDICINPKKIHSKEWVQSLTFKTRTLKELINNEENIPLVMMDADLLILEDFSDLIDNSYDIQICKREKICTRPKPENYKMRYIACFMIINSQNENVQNFVDDWINRMILMIEKKMKAPYETPALCKTIDDYTNKLKIGSLDEIKISADKKYVDNITKIIHMKSSPVVKYKSVEDGGFEQRVSSVQNFPKEKIMKYVN